MLIVDLYLTDRDRSGTTYSPTSVHNLFCSLVLKRERRSQEYVWGIQYSLLGSKIHHLGQEKSNSLRGSTKVVNVNIHYLGQIQNLGSEQYVLNFSSYSRSKLINFSVDFSSIFQRSSNLNAYRNEAFKDIFSYSGHSL